MKVILTAEQLQEGVDRVAADIAEFYGDRSLTIVGVLTGCVVLMADLIRRLTMPLRIGLVQASSYRGTATAPEALKMNLNLLPDIQNRHVLLVDDIFDTGKDVGRPDRGTAKVQARKCALRGIVAEAWP